MKDPGPNVLEQQIETNRLLAAILAASGAPAAGPGSDPGLSGGGQCQWPILFQMSNPDGVPFAVVCDDACTVALTSLDTEALSLGSALRTNLVAGAGKKCTLSIGPPMGPNETPRIQLAWMTKQYPYFSSITVEFNYDNGTNLLSAGFRLDENQDCAKYMASTGVYTLLSNYVFAHNFYDWKKLDLSVNFPEAKYSYACVNADPYDLSAHALKSAGSSGTKRFWVDIIIANGGADSPVKAYLDEVLITDDLYTGPSE